MVLVQWIDNSHDVLLAIEKGDDHLESNAGETSRIERGFAEAVCPPGLIQHIAAAAGKWG